MTIIRIKPRHWNSLFLQVMDESATRQEKELDAGWKFCTTTKTKAFAVCRVVDYEESLENICESATDYAAENQAAWIFDTGRHGDTERPGLIL